MNCCTECFNDRFLRGFIFDNGEIDSCDYCLTDNIKCVEVQELADIFSPLIELYSPEEDFLPSDELGSTNGTYIWELLQHYWNIFSSDDEQDHENIIRDMFREFDPSESEKYLYDSFWRDPSKYWGTYDIISEEVITKWNKFKNELIYNNRFFLSLEFNFSDIGKLLDHLTKFYDKGRIFSRARKCTSDKKYKISEMGKPPFELALPGRANPFGIPYLYLAKNVETAIAEIRPYKFELVTIGIFKLIDQIKVVDLRRPIIKSPFSFGDELTNIKSYIPLLTILNKILSEPVNQKISSLEYLHSQYLCEYIKNNGYEGIVYDSTQYDNGFNLVLFDDSKIKCTKTELHKIVGTHYSSNNLNRKKKIDKYKWFPVDNA